MVLNIAGPEYDFGQVLYAVLQECEHRRRGLDEATTDDDLQSIARAKLAEVKAAYDEFGGSPAYWSELEREVLTTAMPQYAPAAAEMNALERSAHHVFRRGDVAARIAFALAGLLIGSIIIALPFIPIFEDMFAFATTAAGFFYPDLVRYTNERRYVRFLNHLVIDAERYQSEAKLHYMTATQIRESFAVPPEKLQLKD
ncbi:MAG TPA: hypothetical protein VLU46_07380 [Thermoanaerobaculia bacterium]|nr:hypothetical protein [Thermoanaerobaculia bacterium]